jgi:hypothetical protein
MTNHSEESHALHRQHFDHYYNNGSHIPTDEDTDSRQRRYATHIEQQLIILCYAIIFPLTLLCFALLLRFLRRHSFIGRRSEEELLDVLQYRNTNGMMGRPANV